MSATTLFVVLGNLLFVLVCGTVGVRLALKAKETRQLPEAFLGAGLLCVVVGLPLLAGSGMGRATIGELRLPLAGAGLGLFALSTLFKSAFVWRTFRPGRTWALILVALIGSLGVTVTGQIFLALALANGPADVLASDVARSTVLWLRLPFVITFGWIAFEGFAQYRMARRRESIGIGDPVLTNRFFLWGGTGLFTSLNSIVATVLHANNMSPFIHPLGAASLGIGASISSITLLLVFIPPNRYVNWIRSRRGLRPI